MSLIHYIDFQKLISLRGYFESKPHWIYCSDNNRIWYPSDLTQPKIWSRIYRAPLGYLQFHRRKEDSDDILTKQIGGQSVQVSHRPRIEVVPTFIKIPKNTSVHIQYTFSPVQGGPDFKAIIFQLSDRTPDNEFIPIFQYEIRHGFLFARWCDITEADTSGGTRVQRISDLLEWNTDRFYTLDLYVTLSSDKNKGVFKVALDGEPVFERRAKTATNYPSTCRSQYGIYGNKGFDLRTNVKSLLYETLETL